MELIKKKIILEDGISRRPDSTYGTLTATTFNINILLTQTYDNMGLYTDTEYFNEPVDYSLLITKLNNNGFTFPFMSGVIPPPIIYSGHTGGTRVDGANVSDWYSSGDVIFAETTTRLNELRSYNNALKYIAGFNVDEGVYLNYENNPVNGVSQVVTYNVSGETTYVFDTEDDTNIGTTAQTTGFLFTETPTQVQSSRTGGEFQLRNFKTANLMYKAEGWNSTNTSLSAITKEEYLMGILYPPEVFSDVFIDRGATTVMDKHLKLSELDGVEHLERYGNGYFNIVKV